jgi:hypothetical protein
MHDVDEHLIYIGFYTRQVPADYITKQGIWDPRQTDIEKPQTNHKLPSVYTSYCYIVSGKWHKGLGKALILTY